MRALLAAGADVDARQPGWKTPLMIAAAAGNTSSVRLLLEAGADSTLEDSDEQTAMLQALAHGHNEVADLLRNAVGRR
jgi:ankyrin repeat protein